MDGVAVVGRGVGVGVGKEPVAPVAAMAAAGALRGGRAGAEEECREGGCRSAMSGRGDRSRVRLRVANLRRASSGYCLQCRCSSAAAMRRGHLRAVRMSQLTLAVGDMLAMSRVVLRVVLVVGLCLRIVGSNLLGRADPLQMLSDRVECAIGREGKQLLPSLAAAREVGE